MLAMAAALFCVYAGDKNWWGTSSDETSTLIAVGALAIALVGFIGEIQFIQCPKCGLKLFWHALSAKEHPSGLDWFSKFEECPNCGFAPHTVQGRSTV